MRGRSAVAAVLLFFAVAVRAQTRGAVDWIFLVDTSASMKKNDVFGEVQKSLKTFVAESADGDSVAILTFDRDVRLHTSTTVGRNRGDLDTIVEGLKAEGNRTHLGAAIAKALERERDDPQRTSAIVLFTDGKEDVRGIRDPVPIPSTFDRALQSGAHIFFVSMGEHEPQLRRVPRAQFIEAADAVKIRQVASEIRKIVAPPKPEPPRVTVEPTTLDFGPVDPGELSQERELLIRVDKPTPLYVKLQMTPHLSMAPRDIQVTPGRPVAVKLQVKADEEAPPGLRRIAFDVMGAHNVGATITVNPPSLLERLLPWALLAMAVALIASLLRWRYVRQHQLEGEIEIVKPRVVSDGTYIGLPALEASEIGLSQIVPPDALNGADARLFVRRKGGGKKIWIEATSGLLRVNSIEVPATELYDADTIQIGDATLRFNRVGHERPQEEL